MKRFTANSTGLMLGVCLLSNLIGASPARADDWTWATSAISSNNNWQNSSNWYYSGDTSQNSYFPAADGTADIIFSYPNVIFGGPTNVSNVDTNWSINSLHFVAGPSAGWFLTGNQLTIGAGGIVTSTSGPGPTINNSIVLAAPQTWMATSTLSMTVNGAVNVNSQKLSIDGGGNMNFNGAITGSGQLILNGTGSVTFAGTAANTFSGSVQVNNGTLYLNKPNATNAVGNLTIGSPAGGAGALVQLETSNQINDTSTVTINSTGELYIPNGTQDYFPTLVLNGGFVNTGTAANCFLSFIHNNGLVAANSSTTPAFIEGVVYLNDDPGQFTRFDVAPDAAWSGIGLNIYALMYGGGVTKSGVGTMLLGGANTFAGGVNLNAGSIIVQGNSAGASGSVTSGPLGTGTLTMADQTTLEAKFGNYTIANAISIPSAGTSGIIDGSTNLTLTGTLSGSGGLIKNGTGTLTLSAATNRSLGGGLTINNGAVVLNTGLSPGLTIGGNLAVGAISGQTATLSVNNAVLLQNGAANMIVGATGSGAATVNVGTTDIGTLIPGSGGLTINPTGSVTIGSGSAYGNLNLTQGGNVLIDGGKLEFDAGTLLLPTIPENSIHIQNGGTLTTAVSIPMVITGDGTSSTINVTGNNVTLGIDGLPYIGFSFQGTLNANGRTVTLNSNSYAQLGAFTYLNAGTINAPNGVSLPTGSWLVGGGRLNGRVVGEPGSIISVSLNQTLEMGDASSPAGFNYGGELRVGPLGTMTLDSSGPVTLGNLTTIGGGILNAANGFVLNAGDAITGQGTVNSSNTLALHSVVNGIVQGNSPSQPITLSGWIKGTGALSNVSFAPGATYDPGFSPTTVFVGNIAFSSGFALNIDLGGTTPGSQYDQIISSGTVTLAGTLNLVPYGAYVPAAGDKFVVMTYANATGTFSTINGTSAGPGLTYSVVYEPNALVVLTTANGCNTWSVDSNGSLSSGGNYAGGTPPSGVGAVATFSNVITGNRTVTVDADTTLGTVNFDSPFNYTLTGSHTLTMQAPGPVHASINVSAAHGNGQQTIGVPVQISSDTDITQNSSSPLKMTEGLQDLLGKAMSTSGTGVVLVSGPVNLGPGTNMAVKGNSTLQFGLQSGQQASVGSAVKAQVSDNATLELAGAASALSGAANRADIENNSLAKEGVRVTGTSQKVGGIDGSGTTGVEAGADLNANHIVQSALVIGGQMLSPGKVTMTSSDPLGRPMDQVEDGLPGLVAASVSPASVSPSLDSPSLSNINPLSTVSTVDGFMPPDGFSSEPVSAAGSTGVPEPSTLVLLALGLAGLAGSCSARKSARWLTDFLPRLRKIQTFVW
jgi:autotransporter-associated beta strand protein